jgi:hypothetical protein
MTRDDIIRMAREADFKAGGGEFWVEQPDGICTSELERLAKLAYEAGAAAERDRWSRLLEDRAVACERAAENTGDPKYDAIARTLMSVREEGLE